MRPMLDRTAACATFDTRGFPGGRSLRRGEIVKRKKGEEVFRKFPGVPAISYLKWPLQIKSIYSRSRSCIKETKSKKGFIPRSEGPRTLLVSVQISHASFCIARFPCFPQVSPHTPSFELTRDERKKEGEKNKKLSSMRL